MNPRYSDMLFLPHPHSFSRRPMPRISRAAQFAPFAALTGYDDAVHETARLTDRQTELDTEQLALMDEKLHALLELIVTQPEITITYFEPDARKSGGAYCCVTGRIRRVDEINRQIIFADRTVIAMDSVCEIDCSLIASHND